MKVIGFPSVIATGLLTAMVGARSLSAILAEPVISSRVTLVGEDKITEKVSSFSSIRSSNPWIVISPVVLPAGIVSVPVAAT